MNGFGLLLRRDRAFLSTTMLMRTANGSGRCSRPRLLLLLRGVFNTLSLFCLLVALDGWLSLADAFAIFVATATVGTTFGARALIGASERLSCKALIGGTLTLCGTSQISLTQAHPFLCSELSHATGTAC